MVLASFRAFLPPHYPRLSFLYSSLFLDSLVWPRVQQTAPIRVAGNEFSGQQVSGELAGQKLASSLPTERSADGRPLQP